MQAFLDQGDPSDMSTNDGRDGIIYWAAKDLGRRHIYDRALIEEVMYLEWAIDDSWELALGIHTGNHDF